MERLVKLMVPYTIQSVTETIVDVIFSAIVGRLLGTEELAVCTVVEIFLGTTSEFLDGIIYAQLTVLAHAVGAGNGYLAGQYTQISFVIYNFFFIFCIIFWFNFMERLVIWLGFPFETAVLAQQYSNVAIFAHLVDSWFATFFGILDVTGHENFNMLLDLCMSAVYLLTILGTIYLNENTNLVDLAWISIFVEIVFGLIGVWFVCIYKDWMNAYLDGIIGNFAMKNFKAVKNVISTAVPLSFGSLLSYGEWEILTIFAAFMGPAEVTAWSLLGTIWECFEATTEGVGDAGEVRVGYHLGKGNPHLARYNAYRCIYISIIVAVVITSILFIIGDALPRLFTDDPTLIAIILDLIPLIGIGNITMSFGMICWALVGGQGRYTLATTIQFFTSWTISLPLAAVMTYVYNFNLEGITSALIIGYQIAGVAMTYVIITSDWEKISKKIIEINVETGDCYSSDSDDESSSSSSEESSSSSSEDSSSSSSEESTSSSSEESSSSSSKKSSSSTPEVSSFTVSDKSSLCTSERSASVSDKSSLCISEKSASVSEESSSSDSQNSTSSSKSKP